MNLIKYQNPDRRLREGDPNDWMGSLPEDIRGSDALKPFAGKGVDELAKGYISTQQMLGARIPIPGEKADEATLTEFRGKLAKVPGVTMIPGEGDADGWKAFYRKLGVPETAAEYGVSKPENLPAGVEFNEEGFKGMLEAAHAANLNRAQVQKLVEFRMNEVAAQAKAYGDMATAAQTALKTEWGSSYEQKMGIGRKAAEAYGEQDGAVLVELAQTVPAVARALHALGMQTLEDPVIRNIIGGEPLRNPAEIKAELDALTQQDAYINNRNPEHAAVMVKASKLQQELYNAKNAAA